ncbi:MAG: multicopper oxidase domain-containing protein, partial [Deltaproteobacteria bacterium]|nr:multicopper oxidase domain-containing protein [Deltaproteobacteria bacterium]
MGTGGFRRFSLCWAMAVILLLLGVAQGHARPLTFPGGVPDYYETPNWANSPPLRKFVDTLPGLNTPNNLGQMITVAIPDTTTYPGSDYYEIELVEYREQMHSDLPPVVGSKMDPAATGGTLLRGYRQTNTANADLLTPHYLGPVIVAQKSRPVRVKFTNALPTGAGGNLFLPVDETIMGSGPFEIDYDPVTKAPIPLISGTFSQNRATLHLHGGKSPWISDGTPHQWITPAGEVTDYAKGVSVAYVPDMWFDASGNTIAACAGLTTCGVAGASNNPGPGAQTFYWTNQQSGRFMFYHDHSWGITRLNVYAGEAAGYLIQDNVELALVNGGTVGGRTFAAGTIPSAMIPLVIQDKTFVDNATLANTDPTWAWGSQPWNGTAGVPTTPVKGDLWYPHVYMPAENPYNPDLTGMNPFGRWFYGPWFYPATPLCGSSATAIPPYCITQGPVPNYHYLNDTNCYPVETPLCTQPPEMPGTPNVSWGAEAFMDTMLVNGTAYPSLTVQPQAYRFRILNAANDRFLNLQLYIADDTYLPGDPGYLKEVKMVASAIRQSCSATVTTNCVCTATDSPAGCFPDTWPADGREGGVPDPAMRGPALIQVGTEGGFLPKPVVLPNQPVSWNYDPTTFSFGNVNGGTLILGPAERADVIVDFSQYAGKTLILYNDAPTAFPALVPQYDYYTGAPDRRDIGGANTIPPGFAPNNRTVMQVNVAGSGGTAPPDYYNPATLTALDNAFRSTPGSPGVFALGQADIIVGQSDYDTAYDKTFPATWPNWGIVRITDNTVSFNKLDDTTMKNFIMRPKAIHDEMGGSFDELGRMAAKLGLEVVSPSAANANFILQNYVDPPTELMESGEVQIWKITHNGVDTHPIHFHLFDVQVLNRVAWDGIITLPDLNELGWKDTVRINPLMDTIVAMRAALPVVPFALPNSVRPLNPAAPLGSTMGFSQINTVDGGPLATPMTNSLYDFGHEYVWHCHILAHEENDMMRSISARVPTAPPAAPS